MSKHNELGIKGEILAADYFLKKGYTILETNWRFEKAEVDIIARENRTLVFTEVKTRSGDYFGHPESAVDTEKQRNLAKAAEAYLDQKKLNLEVRFDVISITMNSGLPKIYHIRDAFFPYEF